MQVLLHRCKLDIKAYEFDVYFRRDKNNNFFCELDIDRIPVYTQYIIDNKRNTHIVLSSSNPIMWGCSIIPAQIHIIKWSFSLPNSSLSCCLTPLVTEIHSQSYEGCILWKKLQKSFRDIVKNESRNLKLTSNKHIIRLKREQGKIPAASNTTT